MHCNFVDSARDTVYCRVLIIYTLGQLVAILAALCFAQALWNCILYFTGYSFVIVLLFHAYCTHLIFELYLRSLRVTYMKLYQNPGYVLAVRDCKNVCHTSYTDKAPC